MNHRAYIDGYLHKEASPFTGLGQAMKYIRRHYNPSKFGKVQEPAKLGMSDQDAFMQSLGPATGAGSINPAPRYKDVPVDPNVQTNMSPDFFKKFKQTLKSVGRPAYPNRGNAHVTP